MNLCRSGLASLATLCLFGQAAAQAFNEGLTTATVVDISVPATTLQQNSYNVPGETAVATPMATSSTAVNYGASTLATVSSSVDAMTAYVTATQPLNGLISYAEARSQPTIDDFATLMGPQPIGTPVTLTLTMIVGGSYAYPSIDDAQDLNLAGDNLSYNDHTLGIEDSVLGSSNAGHSISPLTLTFGAKIGDSIELNYGLDAWVYVAGNSTLSDTETVSLGLTALYAKANLPGVELLSLTGHSYAVPAPCGLAVLGVGLLGLTLRRRRT